MSLKRALHTASLPSVVQAVFAVPEVRLTTRMQGSSEAAHCNNIKFNFHMQKSMSALITSIQCLHSLQLLCRWFGRLEGISRAGHGPSALAGGPCGKRAATQGELAVCRGGSCFVHTGVPLLSWQTNMSFAPALLLLPSAPANTQAACCAPSASAFDGAVILIPIRALAPTSCLT